MLEYVKKSNNFDEKQQMAIANGIKTCMRCPNDFMVILKSNKDVNMFVTKYANYIIEKKPAHIPVFFQTFAFRINQLTTGSQSIFNKLFK